MVRDPARTGLHLAQINMGRAQATLTDPRLAEFVAQLDEINALADRSPGFVWRLQTDAGNATDIKVSDDPRLIVNMSVWESLDALTAYVYKSGHLRVLSRRKEWFERLDTPSIALWWIGDTGIDDGVRAFGRHGPCAAFVGQRPFYVGADDRRSLGHPVVEVPRRCNLHGPASLDEPPSCLIGASRATGAGGVCGRGGGAYRASQGHGQDGAGGPGNRSGEGTRLGRILRCLGTGTIEASMIWPPIAK